MPPPTMSRAKGRLVAVSYSSHTKGSRDSMTPSVTSGAMTGSAARKMHARLARGSSISMNVLQGVLESSAALPRPITNDRQNGANIPEGSLKIACCGASISQVTDGFRNNLRQSSLGMRWGR